MINTITFDSQMAMAGAMSAVFAAKSGSVNESVKKETKADAKTQVVTESAKPIMANKPEKKAVAATPAKKVCCESDTAQARLAKFRAAHMAKAAKKQLKTCSTKVCECGTQTGEGENATPAQTPQTAPVTEDVPETGKETTGAPDTGIADGVADGGDGDGEGAGSGEADGGEGEGDKKELVAHASAVSERLASLKEKLVQELDADDGLKLGTQDGGTGEGDGEGDVDGGDADDDTEEVNQEA